MRGKRAEFGSVMEAIAWALAGNASGPFTAFVSGYATLVFISVNENGVWEWTYGY